MIPVIVAEVLDELAHGIPDLHGAACRGHADAADGSPARKRSAPKWSLT